VADDGADDDADDDDSEMPLGRHIATSVDTSRSESYWLTEVPTLISEFDRRPTAICLLAQPVISL